MTIFMFIINFILLMFVVSFIVLGFNLLYINSNLNIYYPMNQMVILIFMIVFMSIYIYFFKNSSIYSLLLLITYISGILVTFSYFTALVNYPLEFNYIKSMIVSMIIGMFFGFVVVYMNFDYQYFYLYEVDYEIGSMNEMFCRGKIYVYIILLFLLTVILFMSIMISYSKGFALRSIK